MKKKAQENIALYFTIFELIWLVIAGGYLYGHVSSFNDAGVQHKLFLSRHLALKLDILSFIPGNMEINYVELLNQNSINPENFIFNFDKNYVEVSLIPDYRQKGFLSLGGSKGKLASTHYQFMTNNKYTYDLKKVSSPKKLVITKNGMDINTNAQASSLTKLRCEPASYRGNVHLIYSNIGAKKEEKELIVQQLIQVQDTIIYSTTNKGSDLTLTLELANNPKNIDIIKVYYTSGEEVTRRLGCDIINNILDEFPLTRGVQLIPKDLSAKSLIIQVGNEQFDNTNTIIGSRLNAIKTANAIHNGLL